VKCYIDNYVCLQSCIRNVNSCPYRCYSWPNNLLGLVYESLEGKGACFVTFVGRLERNLCKSADELKCHITFKPGTKFFIDTGGKWLPDEKSVYHLMLKHIFWWFLQCVHDFSHCRPVISVDNTFLTRKYKGTLMVAVGITTKVTYYHMHLC
jgi:hypothetical protein